VDRYRKLAAEYDELASNAASPFLRVYFQRIAEQYRQQAAGELRVVEQDGAGHQLQGCSLGAGLSRRYVGGARIGVAAPETGRPCVESGSRAKRPEGPGLKRVLELPTLSTCRRLSGGRYNRRKRRTKATSRKSCGRCTSPTCAGSAPWRGGLDAVPPHIPRASASIASLTSASVRFSPARSCGHPSTSSRVDELNQTTALCLRLFGVAVDPVRLVRVATLPA
jgi:hypothetical protein